MVLKKIIRFILGVGILSTSFVSHPAWSQPNPGAEVNLREEMTALDRAFKTIIDAVVLGDIQRISPALMEVTEARESLERAIKAGQMILLPKNQGQFREFLKLDEQFHIDLEELRSAAETGQRKAVKNYVHKLLDSCIACHERYRK